VSVSDEQFEALGNRVATIEEREQMPLAYQREARELAEVLGKVQFLDVERLKRAEERIAALERPWWRRLVGGKG
jgi:hypothetical protein